MWKRALLCVFYLLFNSSFLMAEDEATEVVNDYQYFQLEPDIITNYVKPGKRIGFVRITIDLMASSAGDLALIETHEPLIRDKIIRIFGTLTEDVVKSTAARDDIRLRCLEEVNDMLKKETGEKPLEDLFFTKYLYQ